MSNETQLLSNNELATALLQPARDEQQQSSPQPQQPIKVRKKPGRKPNPASPALRKAQNRAAQRAFRERKERHLRELETAVKQLREQRDKLQAENEQFRHDSDILRSENWYLKGIVLTLQLVCFRHNLVIPSHSPYMNEEALGLLAHTIPEPISAYLNANANNKLPVPSRLFDYSPSKPRDRYLSQGSLYITKDGISNQAPTEFDNFPTATINNTDDLASELPALSPVADDEVPLPSPPQQLEEPITSNLAAIQILRLRLRLQSACAQMDSTPFAIQPTVLQLTIPHDPRIDLIPTPHMRDRMILFRDLFDLDDCFRCLIGNSVFHGGDPAVAANWQLPPEFFDKFWFLTIDFSLQRTTNRWRKLQGLKELPQGSEKRQTSPALAAALANMPQLSSALNSFPPPSLNNNKSINKNNNYASSLASDTSSSGESDSTLFFASPVQLTNGYMPTSQPQDKETDLLMDTSTCHPWDTMLSPSDNDYGMCNKKQRGDVCVLFTHSYHLLDMIMDTLIDTDQA
ncbi:hypothetical protein BJV82DRAFT_513859 [Fennellomyces sp. T-0311]|nr:hypothetical protein BJV82DRAFT_513859 [Fennellomyces sp. T-0311]